MDIILTVLGVIIVFIVIAVAVVVIKMGSAKYFAIRDRKTEVVLFGGFVKLVLWEMNEGLVFLRNKAISDVINQSSGGTRFIFPARGEELRARIPLNTHMVQWEDANILTRESIRVRMKVALWWRVADLRKYVFQIDQSIHVGNTHAEVSLLESAETWLKTITESTLRTIVSQLSVAFLVSSKATSYLHVEHKHDQNPGSQAVEVLAPDSMADELQKTLARKMADYGVTIQRIEIQEISLSPEIQLAIDKVWQASLLPAQTEQEAKARQIELQAVANVLGVEATALNEIMKNFQGSNFFGMPQFLESLFSKANLKPNKGLPSEAVSQLKSVAGIDKTE
jgi:regulator of protease activity HflC (stomatin/prohibitin superfamily)